MTAFVEFSGSAAVVTGAGSGIGRACALEFANRGSMVVVSDVEEDRAEAVAAEVRELGGKAVALRCDVTQDADVERLRDVCLASFGRVDIVMNNVGVIAMGPPQSLPLDAWQRVIDVNLLGLVRSNLVFLPLLIEQGHGHIVNTASASGLLPHGYDRLPYIATKHAVVGVSESLALYLRPKGIGVTCLCPSGVRTLIREQITHYGEPSKALSPSFPAVDPEVAADLVADAIAEGRFLVLTASEVHDDFVERANDMDAYLLRIVDEQANFRKY